VSSSALNVYSTPDLRTKPIHTLSSNSEFKILEHGIINLAFEKIRWFKIKKDSVEGFLSEQVLEKREIASFEESPLPEEAFVSASSLRVRKNPSLTGEVIASLPRNTRVEILSKGKTLEQIDNKYDAWVRIKTADGKIGFCFRGYLIFGLNPDWNEVVFPGFIEIKSEKAILKSPEGEKFSDKDFEGNGVANYFQTVMANFIYPVETKATIGEKVFYSVMESYSECEPFGGCISGIVQFWIPAEDVKYFDTSLSDYTLQKYGDENQAILNYAKAKLGADIDVRNIKIEPAGENAEGISFLILNVSLDTPYNKMEAPGYYGILQNKNGEYSEIYKVSDSMAGISTHDFDSDGVSEFIINSGGRGSSNSVFYSIKDKRLNQLLELTSGEAYDDAKGSYYGNYEIKENKVIYTKELFENNTGNPSGKKETVNYTYANGKFKKN
jgi:hypothetical protein